MKFFGQFVLFVSIVALGLFVVLRVFSSPLKSDAGANRGRLNFVETERHPAR
jgi:hypothetical protein